MKANPTSTASLMLRNRPLVGAGPRWNRDPKRLVPAQKRSFPTATTSQGNHKGCPYRNQPNVEVEAPHFALSFYRSQHLNLAVQSDECIPRKIGQSIRG